MKSFNSPYPADRMPNFIQVLFNGLNVACWAILEPAKVKPQFLDSLRDNVGDLPKSLQFVEVMFDSTMVLVLTSDGEVKRNFLDSFYQQHPLYLVKLRDEFTFPPPRFLLDWESLQNAHRICQQEAQVIAEIRQGKIPF